MRIISRFSPKRKPRFLRGEPVTIGWRRTRDEILYFCISPCNRTHASIIGAAGRCPRTRKAREFIVADFGPAPDAIVKADEAGRLNREAQRVILSAFEKLDRVLAKDSPPTPTLDAFKYTNARGLTNLIVHCKYCRHWHFHGIGRKPGEADGHRVCHCHVNWSPYNRTGYRLREIGPATDEIRRDVKRRRAKGVKK
jgi:hypothetical protein